MADAHSAPSAGRFEVRVTADSHFSWIRTRLSLERTMMSWIRTAVSLIGFGFAIVQFFERLQQMPGLPFIQTLVSHDGSSRSSHRGQGLSV
jgi:putative membrane protein